MTHCNKVSDVSESQTQTAFSEEFGRWKELEKSGGMFSDLGGKGEPPHCCCSS